MSETKIHTTLTAIVPPLNATGPKTRWYKATLTSLHAAEELLDQLESDGFSERMLSVIDDGFVVRWR